ncbi:hypothetical protein BHM03_00001461 [Ensete ventricosum]|nr:hypothetical protein BHM03_00001461 [Ensete ventricosum]
MCNAVRPSRSMLFTSNPSLRRSSTPLASPWHAMNRSRMVASRFSGKPSSPATGLRRLGSSDDCRPKANRLALPSLGSSEACRRRLNLLFDSDPSESCRETPRFSFATTSIPARLTLRNRIKTQSLRLGSIPETGSSNWKADFAEKRERQEETLRIFGTEEEKNGILPEKNSNPYPAGVDFIPPQGELVVVGEARVTGSEGSSATRVMWDPPNRRCVLQLVNGKRRGFSRCVP